MKSLGLLSSPMKKNHDHIPTRTCIACRRTASKYEFLRMALVKGRPVWDYKRCLPGRGAYVCPGNECLEKVRHNIRGCIDRAFRRKFSSQELSHLWGPIIN